jgi:5-methylcytosine-specific restriction endonuclease McrA
MKTCTKCKIEKQYDQYRRDSKSKDGFRSNCKDCSAKAGAAYYAANKERFAIANKEYYKANKEAVLAQKKQYNLKNAESISIQTMLYRQKNLKAISAQKRQHYIKNKEQILSKLKSYYEKNPEKFTAYSRSRKARKKNAEGSHSSADVIVIFEAQKGLCANCQTGLFKSGKQKFHVDHIMPLARGGSNWPSNLQCLCPACNLSKNAKDPIKWAQENGRLL